MRQQTRNNIGETRLGVSGISYKQLERSADWVRSSIARKAGLALLCFVLAGQAHAETRKLKLYFLHTGEKSEITFKRNGKYIDTGLKKINRFLRDWRRNEPTKMDPRLLDLIWEVYQETGSKNHIHVVSAYRSPATNSMLRKRGRGVAKKSQHTLGKALDFFIPGVKLSTLRNIGLRKGLGGVGFYPKSGSPFVHMDTGRVRHWPRMSRGELVKVFPSGKTLHVPTDGKPLKRYNQAKAEYDRKVSGRGKIVVAKAEEIKKKPSLFARVLGRGEDDDEAASVAAATSPRPVRTTAPPIAVPTPNTPVPGNPIPSAPVQDASIAPSQAILSQGPISESVESQLAALSPSLTPVPTLSRRKTLLARVEPEPDIPEPTQSDAAIEVKRPEEDNSDIQIAANEQSTDPLGTEPNLQSSSEENSLEVASSDGSEGNLANVAIPVAANRPRPETTFETEPAEKQSNETQIALLEPEVGQASGDGSPVIPTRRPTSLATNQAETNATPTVVASAPTRINDDFLDLRSAYNASTQLAQSGDPLTASETPTSIVSASEQGVSEQPQQIAALPLEPGVKQTNKLAIPASNPIRKEVETLTVASAPLPLEPGAATTGNAGYPTTSPQRPVETVEFASSENLEPIEPGAKSQGLTAFPSTNPIREALPSAVTIAQASPEPIEPIEPGLVSNGATGIPSTSPNRPVEIAASAPQPIEPGIASTGLTGLPSSNPVRLKKAAQQRLALAFPQPVEPGFLSTGKTGHPTSNPQRVALSVTTQLEPIEPNAVTSGAVTAPVTSPRRGEISVATLIEEAKSLQPIDPEFGRQNTSKLPTQSPVRVKQDQVELAAIDAQRRAASTGNAPTSLIGLKSTVIDTDLLSRTSLASAQPLVSLNQIRPPAYGKNVIREKPSAVLSQGFNRQQSYNVQYSFSGKAVQFLNFNKFN